jgi:hypothetical protein
MPATLGGRGPGAPAGLADAAVHGARLAKRGLRDRGATPFVGIQSCTMLALSEIKPNKPVRYLIISKI